ncbi:MAG TPA: alpha/beta hydrolase [Candidatus Limnocylindria bacterium]|nr:alpha/beta hydrolase [Candidatus Limnocylindria bacterium]
MRQAAVAFVLLLLSTAPARALVPTPRVDALLLEPGTPASLRSRLLTYADSVAAGSSGLAGEAWFFAGMSHDRGGNGDSAILCYERAVNLRGFSDERIALVAALLRRQGPQDVPAAQSHVRTLLLESSGGELNAPLQGWLAWATHLAGQSDSAAILFKPLETLLSHDLEWRFRLGQVSLARRDGRQAYRWLLPLAVRSRKQDVDVMDMLRKSLEGDVPADRIEREIDRQIGARDRGVAKIVQEIGGKPVRFSGVDRFPLGGVVVAGSGAKRQRAAIVLVAHEDTLAAYDSLAVAFRRSGFAVMLMDVRGAGRSVGPFCPLPSTWRGREDLMQSLCAGDIAPALRALASAAPIDTTRYVLIASGGAAPIAVEAAARDPRAEILVLASPTPSVVGRGAMRADLGTRKLPVHFVTAPEDIGIVGFVESLYAMADRAASRVVEARVPGSGAIVLRRSRDTLTRCVRWVQETWAANAKRATRPTPPRR